MDGGIKLYGRLINSETGSSESPFVNILSSSLRTGQTALQSMASRCIGPESRLLSNMRWLAMAICKNFPMVACYSRYKYCEYYVRCHACK